MAAVPITFQGMVYPRDKSGDPYPATLVGFAHISGLGPGGGPIEPPPDIQPKPPLVIWGGANEPFPGYGLPEPPPDKPPAQPEPPHEGWNWSAAKNGWYYLYVPGEGEAGPKKK